MSMQLPHPTVGNLGMQGGFPQQPQQPGIGMPQYQGQAPVNGYVQQQPQPQMQPQFGAPQQQFVPQQQAMTPLPMPQMQQQLPPQQGQRASFTGNEILDGPGVPMELRGRTMQQAMQIYGALADDHLQRRRQPQQQGQQPQMQQQPQFGAPQQQAQQPIPAQGQRPPTFWQNPDAAMQAGVQQAVQQAVAPMNEFVLRQAIQGAQQQVFGNTPDFAQLQSELLPLLRDASPENLARPEFLEGAVDLARGRMLRRVQQPQQGYGQQQFGQPQQQPMVPMQPQRFAPAPQSFQPAPPPTYSFFTEGPTPPMGVWGGQQGDLSPQEAAVAAGFGMDPATYRAWKGGSQQAQNQRRW